MYVDGSPTAVPKRGCSWSNGYTVESVLMQLQTLLGSEQFLKAQKDYGDEVTFVATAFVA